jgi:arabinose-5-phosphate isomerase
MRGGALKAGPVPVDESRRDTPATSEKSSALTTGRRVLRDEAAAVLAMSDRLDDSFEEAIDAIHRCHGRVIVSGVGKSGIIGRKIASTLTSTGCPAVFLHPVEALHGDLGMVGPDDVALVLSKSGETEELRGLVAYLAHGGVTIIALVGARTSSLARAASVALDCGVESEACSLGLAPTSSSTAALAMGDALAVALLERRGFRPEDFALFHPGGSLGRSLARVADLMLTSDLPLIRQDTSVREAAIVLARHRGIALVSEDGRRLAAVFTAGDLTRALEYGAASLELPVIRFATAKPLTTSPEQLAAAAVGAMERKGVMAVPVLTAGDLIAGVLHLHDLMRARVG